MTTTKSQLQLLANINALLADVQATFDLIEKGRQLNPEHGAFQMQLDFHFARATESKKRLEEMKHRLLTEV